MKKQSLYLNILTNILYNIINNSNMHTIKHDCKAGLNIILNK